MSADPKKVVEPSSRSAGNLPRSLADSADLRFINEQHTFPSSASVGRGGMLERLRSSLRRLLFGDYFIREQEFHAHLVRHLNEITKLLASKEHRLADDHWATVDTLERRLTNSLHQLAAELRSSVDSLKHADTLQQSQLTALESVTKGLERLVAGAKPAKVAPSTDTGETPLSPNAPAVPGFDPTYVLLENRFRGGEAEISQRLQSYVDIFRGSALPVLEIGAGRGELQRHFQQAGVKSYALEVDEGMLARLRADNIDVHGEDAVTHLRKLAAGSLGGVVAVQVIEHLAPEYLRQLIEESRRALAVGSRMVFETINTESLLSLCHNYFRDPTHKAPMHPDTLRFLVEIAGFTVEKIEPLSPFPHSAMLQTLQVADFMSPRWQEFVDVLNHNISELNRLLYGFQDYRLIAKAV